MGTYPVPGSTIFFDSRHLHPTHPIVLHLYTVHTCRVKYPYVLVLHVRYLCAHTYTY